MPEERSDQDLILKVRAGDVSAWDAFYRQQYQAVYRICFGFLVNTAEAEDMAQDVMLHLIDRLDAYDTARKFSTWRNTVAANLCRDRLRRKATRQRAEEAAAEAATRRLTLVRDDPMDHASSSEVAGILKESLEALSEREREVFVLRDLEGVPSSDVAASLGICEGTVRSLLSLARRRLRGILGPRLPELARTGSDGNDASNGGSDGPESSR